MDDVIEIIEKERKNKKIPKGKLAKMLGYTPSWYSEILSGKLTLKIPDFIKIAKILKVAPSSLFPEGKAMNIAEMSLFDLIKTICKNEIEKYLNKSNIKEG